MGDLLKYVKAAAKWYTLGSHLGVDRHKLEAIYKDYSNNSEAPSGNVWSVVRQCPEPIMENHCQSS